MQCLIVVSNKKDFDAYIVEFVERYSIRPFHIHTFEEKFKIADVRSLQQILSIQLSSFEKRLVVIKNTVTFDAQHALLKTLEEIPESSFIILHAEGSIDLLPTIQSRCKIVRLTHSTKDISQIDFKPTIENALSLAEKISQSEDTKEAYKELLLSMRSNILEEFFSSNNFTSLYTKYNILYTLLCSYELVKNNNVNPRLAFEEAFVRNL